ncbi:recombinase RarA [Alishewanella longhuensis]
MPGLTNVLEQLAELAEPGSCITAEQVKQVVPQQLAGFDREGDVFYDLISAFHKSVWGSDPDAALYWYARILRWW